jgi:hypothetical protein
MQDTKLGDEMPIGECFVVTLQRLAVPINNLRIARRGLRVRVGYLVRAPFNAAALVLPPVTSAQMQRRKYRLEHYIPADRALNKHLPEPLLSDPPRPEPHEIRACRRNGFGTLCA